MGSIVRVPIWQDIKLSNLDAQGHVEIEIDEASTWVNKEQAQQIINHLKEQFEL